MFVEFPTAVGVVYVNPNSVNFIRDYQSGGCQVVFSDSADYVDDLFSPLSAKEAALKLSGVKIDAP